MRGDARAGDDGSSGGGVQDSDFIPGIVRISGESTDGYMKTLIDIAASTLKNIIDPKCASWLGTGDTGNFSHFVDSVLGVVGYGTIQRVDPATGTILSSNGINAATGGSTSLSITINTAGAFFNSSGTTDNGKIDRGTLKAQVFLLIHEFAHLNNVPGFLSDKNSQGAGTTNNTSIEQNCDDTLKKAVLK